MAKQMLQLFLFLVVMTANIGLNSLYFEYCVSRATPSFLIVVATIGIIIVDILMFIYMVKIIKTITKL